MNLTHAFSFLAFALIVVGLAHRHSKARHRAFMLAAFAIDLGLVLWIEINRHAVAQTIDAARNPLPSGLLGFHILISTLTMALYFVQIVIGMRIYSGKPASRRAHILAGLAFVIARATNLITSFMIALR